MFFDKLTDQHKKDIHFFFTSLGSLVTSVSLVQAIKYQLRINTLQRQIKFLEKQDVKTPSQVLAQANQSLQNKSKNTVMVKGQATCPYEAPYSIRIGKVVGQDFIKHIQYKEKMYSNQSFDLTKNVYKINLNELLKVSEMRSVKDFAVADINSKNPKNLKVINHDISKYEKALQMLKFTQDKHNLSLFQNFESLFLSLIRALVTVAIPDQNVTFLRGIETGIRTVDVGIKVGTPLTILGTILADKNGNIVIEPELIFKDRLRYLLELKDQLVQQSSKRNFWVIATVLAGTYVGRRLYKYIQKNGWVAPWSLRKA